MTRPDAPVIPVTLACGHTARYRHTPPKPGDLVWCRACVTWQEVETEQEPRS